VKVDKPEDRSSARGGGATVPPAVAATG